MPFENINIWALLVSSVTSMVIGSVWYGPLFGTQFMKATGMDKLSKKQQDEMKKRMPLVFALQFIASFGTFFVLAWLLNATNAGTVAGSLMLSLIVWAGIIVPIKFGEQLWGGKMILFYLGAGNMLITFLAAGAIIGAWR